MFARFVTEQEEKEKLWQPLVQPKCKSVQVRFRFRVWGNNWLVMVVTINVSQIGIIKLTRQTCSAVPAS